MVYGVGIYDGNEPTKGNPAYKCWTNILERCYSPRSLVKRPSYKNVSVCTEWKTYSNFKTWYDKNYIDGYEIDKDLLSPSQLVYSPATCIFVPKLVNMCINDGGSNAVLGVRYKNKNKDMKNEHTKPYCSEISKYNKKIHIGYYHTEYEAHLAWQHEKIKYLNELIATYEGIVDRRIIDAIGELVTTISDDIICTRITKYKR